MNSMFPGHGRRDGGHDAGGGAADKNYRPGPRDYNRPVHNITQDQDLSTWPHPLRWAYWVLVVAAVIMLVSGMVGIFGGGGVQVEPSDSRIAEYVRSNRLFVSAFNIIGAIILALFSAQLATDRSGRAALFPLSSQLPSFSILRPWRLALAGSAFCSSL